MKFRSKHDGMTSSYCVFEVYDFSVRQVISEWLCLVLFLTDQQRTGGPIIVSPLKTLVRFERNSMRMNQYYSHFVPMRDSSECLVYVCLIFMKYKGNGAKVCCQTLVPNYYCEMLLSR